MARNRIFISYSHKDEKLFQEFLLHLKSLQNQGIIDIWTDKRLEAGQEWHSEIQQGVASAAVAVLLISPDFMASNYIRDHEIPPLLQAAEAGELRLAPLYLSTVFLDSDHPLSRYQGLNSPDKTPLGKPKAQRNDIFASAARQLKQLIEGSGGHDHRFGHNHHQVSDRGMQNQSRLNKKIDDLQQQWESLSEKLSVLNQGWILETRPEEKLRLKKLIDDAKAQRDQVEEQLKDMESQLAKVGRDAKEGAGRNDDHGRSGGTSLPSHPKPPAKRLPFEPELVVIPAGPFWMGSQPGPGIPAYELPRHQVVLPAYQIGKYPVTNRQYAEFIKQEKQRDEPAGWFLRQPPRDKLEHPVTGISWFDARAYCEWLSQATERRYRLPTEAEWEKAARGVDGRQYPWGDAWETGRCPQGSQSTAPVSAYPGGAGVYGCCDLLGNVQQWTSTLWGGKPDQPDFAYPYDAGDGREDAEAEQQLNQTYRIHRGGSYRDPATELRCTARGFSPPDSKVAWRGLRVALTIGAD
ncbi:MAG: SUMF1/EgtB/PvdO family nonheme iron enzyme [Candidatus Competibacteraceae bacterium]